MMHHTPALMDLQQQFRAARQPHTVRSQRIPVVNQRGPGAMAPIRHIFADGIHRLHLGLAVN